MGDRDGRDKKGELDGVSLSRFEGVDAISPNTHWLARRKRTGRVQTLKSGVLASGASRREEYDRGLGYGPRATKV